MLNLKGVLETYENEFGLAKSAQKIPCTKSQNEQYNSMLINGQGLPHGIYQYTTEAGIGTGNFYRADESEKSDLSDDEKIRLIELKQLKFLRTIKNCTVFFTVITAASLIISFLSIIMLR